MHVLCSFTRRDVGLEYRALGVVYAETAESRHLANYPYGAVFTFDLLALRAVFFSIYLTVYVVLMTQ